MDNQDRKKIKIIFGILLFSAVIGIEYGYRIPLFDKSVELITDLSSIRTDSGIQFFKFITFFGTAGIFIPIYILISNWFPLNKSFSYLLTYALAAYLTNVMKNIYNNPRPYWVTTNIEIVECSGGYGNPSGHAFSSASVYLAIWNITSDTEFFNSRPWLKWSYLIITLGFASLIIYSRFYLGVHAINQLLYGSSLGISTYVFIFHILEVNKYDYKDFFNLFTTISNIIIYWGFYISSLILTILLYNLNSVDETYRNYLTTKCPSIKPYRIMKQDALSDSLLICSLMGCHLGLTILQFLLRKYFPEEDKLQYIHNFVNTNIKKSILRLIFLGLVGIPTLIPLAAVSDNADFTLICVLKIGFSYFTTLAIVNSVGLFFAFKLNLTFNNSLEKVQIESSEIKEVQEKQSAELKLSEKNI